MRTMQMEMREVAQRGGGKKTKERNERPYPHTAFNSKAQRGYESSAAGDDAACAQGRFIVPLHLSRTELGQPHSLYCVFFRRLYKRCRGSLLSGQPVFADSFVNMYRS